MAKTERKPWTRDELLLAINLYCKTPFGRIHTGNADIIELAGRLGRTPGSVGMKLANFASIDPSLDRKGASHFSRLDKKVWDEFFNDWDSMVFTSEQMLMQVKDQELPWPEVTALPEGVTRDCVVRARVNQDFFRRMILAQYDERCCVTGLPIKELLVASHIAPHARLFRAWRRPDPGIRGGPYQTSPSFPAGPEASGIPPDPGFRDLEGLANAEAVA